MKPPPKNYDSEVFQLAMATAFYHPDPPIRKELRAVLDTWLGNLGKGPDPDTVTKLITTESGTTIEPFVLTTEDVECALFLARAAFSEKGGQARLRIVSRDTIGRVGGLVLTNNLKSFYSERYALGEHRHRQKSGWSFVPNALPEDGEDCPSIIEATIHADDNGFRIVVPVPEYQEDVTRTARALQKYSSLAGVKGSLSSLGLRVECHQKEVHVLSGSPESMIRMMAHMIGNATLSLKTGPKLPDMPVTLIRLGAPEDKPLTVPAMVGSTASYSSWMTGEVLEAVPLTDSHQSAITNWLRPHPNWLESQFADLS